uniref:Uncharacterized protein n=1 Tax=Triticum urartu TaxID=4572 RepID=A0A8R7P413_TRIUA
ASPSASCSSTPPTAPGSSSSVTAPCTGLARSRASTYVPRFATPVTPNAPLSAAKSAPTGPCSAPVAVRCLTAAVEPPPWMLTPAATRPPRSSASSSSTRRRRMRTSMSGSPTTSPKSYTRFRSRAHVNRCRQEHACDIITIRDASQKDVVRS